MHTPHDTAALLVVIARRSSQPRARISRATLLMVAARERLRAAFLVDVRKELAELGWLLAELDSGGFGMLRASALEAAKPVTAKKWLTDEERRALRVGTLDLAAIRREAVAGERDQAPDDDG